MDNLDGLMPLFSERVKEFIIEANYQGLHVDVFSGYRSIEQQNDDYAQGRIRAGKIITNASGGHSWHNWGLAVDVVFKDQLGHWTWNVPQEAWEELASIAKQVASLEWGGNWQGSLEDTDHFQLTGGLTIAEALEIGDIKKVWAEVSRRTNG